MARKPKSETPADPNAPAPEKKKKAADGPRYKVDLGITNTPIKMRIQTFRSPKTSVYSSRVVVFQEGTGDNKPRSSGASQEHGKDQAAFEAAKARVEKLVAEAVAAGWTVLKVARPKRVDQFSTIPSAAEMLAALLQQPEAPAETPDEDYQSA